MLCLLTQYYRDAVPERQQEIETCLRKNLAHDAIDQVVLLCAESCTPDVQHPKLRLYETMKRPPVHATGRATYQQFFDVSDELAAGDSQHIALVANSDIYFDESLAEIEKLGEHDFFALGRWDVMPDGGLKLFDVPYAQDAWAWRGKLLPFFERSHASEWPLGYPGCDNRVAQHARHLGYAVYNPCRTIRALHLHVSQVRNYPANQVDKKYCADRIKPPYLHVEPAHLGELPTYTTINPIQYFYRKLRETDVAGFRKDRGKHR